MLKSEKNEGVIVVIGATGTLGTYFVDELIDKGYKVFATGRRNVKKDYYASKGVECALLDITWKEHFDRLPSKDVRAVVQFAGSMPSRMVGYNPQNFIDVNITGTLNVLEYCHKTNVNKFMFTQSHSDVAGKWNTGEFIPSDCPRSIIYTGDHAIYIISKCAAVDLIEHYHQEYGIQNISFRLPTIYSYRPVNEMYVGGEKRIIAYRVLIQMAMKGETLEVWGNPKISKDIVYVKDFTQMIIKAMESDNAQGIYNVGTGVSTTLEEQIKGIARVFSPADKPCKIVYRPEKPSQNGYLYDISNATQDFCYKPNYSYIEMLEDMKQEMNGHRFDHLDGVDITI